MAKLKFLTRKRIIEFMLVCHMCRTGAIEFESGGSAETLIEYFSSTVQFNVSENFIRHTTEFRF